MQNLNDLYVLLSDYAENIIKYIAKNWIAIIALILSYLNYRKNNLGIYLDPEDKTDWLLAILLDDGKSIINEYGMLKLNLRIINPSNTDTSFSIWLYSTKKDLIRFISKFKITYIMI
ncbi:TPA: hypothetical protein VON39_001421 [Streptococcus pyogenes]|nr:hypothetical protein [Streptococcus pyogenes]